MTGLTIAQALATATRDLNLVGVDSPELDAELLLAHVLDVDRTWLFAHPEQTLSSAQHAMFRALLRRRAAREPLAYITGRRWFYGLELVVTPAVLIPRPETEELVERALAWLKNRPQAIVADIGTGSGAIALAVAKRTPPEVHIIATDISAKALDVARKNARRLGLEARIRLFHGDLLTPLTQPVDLILANLPYVAERDTAALMPEVGRFEPPEALFSGPAGLEHLQRLLTQAPDFLRTGGAMLLEIGYDQAETVTQMARQRFPAASIHMYRDLAGHDRILEIMTSP